MRSAPIFAVTLLLTLGVSLAFGQRPPEATITPFVEAVEVRPGTSTRVALRVSLPEGLHVQSDRPRDPSLIPTVLTVEPPQGVRVEQLVYPHPTDFAQQGQEQPLAVFEREFVLGAELAIGPDLPRGDLVIPARLRYQACDDKVCFRPVTATITWTVRVGTSAG
jgi:DsbC/DsbD-like thiol-disulfide interchange protein